MAQSRAYDEPWQAIEGIKTHKDEAAAIAALTMIADACSKGEPIPLVLREYLSDAIKGALAVATPAARAYALADGLGIGAQRTKKQTKKTRLRVSCVVFNAVAKSIHQ